MTLIAFGILALVHFGFWLALRTGKLDVMDVLWSLGFVLVGILGYAQNYPTTPKAILLFIVTLWGLRLGWHIFKRAHGKPEDPRYTAMRAEWGADWKREAYKKVFLSQGAALFVVSLPLQLGMSSELERFGAKQMLALLVWAAAFALEVWSDRHLAKFKADPANRGLICMSGPWSYVRFPNYLGEITMWWAIYFYIFGFWTAWTFVGPAALTYAIVKITGIPPIEARYRDRADYQAYAARVPRLIPFLRPRRATV
jgi:steroid 5-alpha reductase family enzyme